MALLGAVPQRDRGGDGSLHRLKVGGHCEEGLGIVPVAEALPSMKFTSMIVRWPRCGCASIDAMALRFKIRAVPVLLLVTGRDGLKAISSLAV